MTNPFVYGEIVPAAAFVDREVELDRLGRDLLRRAEGLPHLPAPLRQVVARPAGPEERGAAAARSPSKSRSAATAPTSPSSKATPGRWPSAETRLDRARSWLREMLSGVRPEVRIEPDESGRSQIAVSFPSVRTDRDVSHLAQQVFALPGRIAEARRRRMAIALDEFQAIGAFNGGSVEHALRAAVQQQRQVGYVFSGSEPTLMERMLGKSRPFYKAGPVMRLQKIPADRFAAFIEARFKATGFKPAAGSRRGDRRSRRQPALRRPAPRARGLGRCEGGRGRTADLEDLHGTLKRLLGEHETLFEGTWQRLTLAQRAALRAAVLEDGRELLSADVRARHRLSGTSTVQASLAALVREDILTREGTRYAVVDSLFREWVARRTF